MKIFKSVLLILLFLFFASWFYKIIMLMLLALVWKNEIKAKRTWGYKVVIISLFMAMFCVLPRYRYNTSDRVQLIYQDKNGNPELPPITHYLVNVFLPEEEVCNICTWGALIAPDAIKLSGWILDEFKQDTQKGNLTNFFTPFKRLNWNGQFLMSGTTSQVFNMFGIDQTQSVYLIKPKNYDKNKTYPVVFFMHGYLGNWKLYQGILKDLEDCIVLSVGTKTWSGLYTENDINALFTKQIPFLEKSGYKIDRKNLHIMGISNGGSASNLAYHKFSKRFKTITFISTNIKHTFPISSKVLLIGGGNDHSAGSLHKAYRTLKRNGVKTYLYWDDNETHFIFVNQTDEIIEFLNKNIKR